MVGEMVDEQVPESTVPSPLPAILPGAAPGDPLAALPERDALICHIGGLPLAIPRATLLAWAEKLWATYAQPASDKHELLLQLAMKGFAQALQLYINFHVDAGHVDWPRLEIPRGQNRTAATMRYLSERLIGLATRADWEVIYEDEPGAEGSDLHGALVLAGVVPSAPGLAPARVARPAALAPADPSGGGGGGAAPAGDPAQCGPRGDGPGIAPPDPEP